MCCRNTLIMNRNSAEVGCVCVWGWLLACILLLYNGQRGCYERLGAGWVRCPQEDHYEEHPGLQIPEVAGTNAADEKRRWGSRTREERKKNKIGHIPMMRVRPTRRGGEMQWKACSLIGGQNELCRAGRHRERSLSEGESCFSARCSTALRPPL